MTAYDTDAMARVAAALAQFGSKRRHGSSNWTCPAHADHDPSLSVDLGLNGSVVMRCHAGCETSAILTAIGLAPADLYDRVRGNATAESHGAVEPVANASRAGYAYPPAPVSSGHLERFLESRGWRADVAALFGLAEVLDELGRPRIRFPFRVGPDTRTWQDRAVGSERPKWRSAAGKPLIPFAFDLRSALAEPIVFLVEGPPDVIALNHLYPTLAVIGLPGVGWARKPAVSRALAGQTVCLAMDNDAEGERARRAAETLLLGEGCRVAHFRYPAEFNDLDEWRRSFHGDDTVFHTAFQALWSHLAWSGAGDGPTLPPEARLRLLESDADRGYQDSKGFVRRWEEGTCIGDAIVALEPPEPLIQGLLDQSTYATLIGAPGAGKSFVAIDMALCVANEIPWAGHRVAPGPVVYVAAEGEAGLGRRVQAWRAHQNHHAVDLNPLYWLPFEVNMFDEVQASEFVRYCRSRRPVLIVIDTMARCILGADENSSRDMGQINHRLDLLAREIGACVLVLHHTGKDPTRGARGSNSVLGAVSTQLDIRSDGGRHHTLRVAKQKEGEPAPPIRLERVNVGQSCVLTLVDSRPMVAPAVADLDVQATLSTLRSLEMTGGVSTAVWLAACEHVAKTTFHKHKKALVEAGAVTNVGTEHRPHWITPAYDGAQAQGLGSSPPSKCP